MQVKANEDSRREAVLPVAFRTTATYFTSKIQLSCNSFLAPALQNHIVLQTMSGNHLCLSSSRSRCCSLSFSECERPGNQQFQSDGQVRGRLRQFSQLVHPISNVYTVCIINYTDYSIMIILSMYDFSWLGDWRRWFQARVYRDFLPSKQTAL